MRGSGALIFCRQAASGSDLRHGRRLRAETSTFLRGRQASRSSWRKSSLPPLTGYRAELGIKPRSSE